jgi:hypothetical protein
LGKQVGGMIRANMSSGDATNTNAPATQGSQRSGEAAAARSPEKGGAPRSRPRPRPDSDGSGLHPTAVGHVSGEHRPPQRVAPGQEEYEDISLREEDESGELTAEEIARETERWAPKTIRETVVDVEKICRVCGKDLKGHRRFKDEKGYICRDCDRDERARRIPCAECGKPVPPEALRPWGPISICTRCWADHESDPKLRIKRKVSSRPWEELEKKTVLAISAVVVLGLFVIFIISLFR